MLGGAGVGAGEETGRAEEGGAEGGAEGAEGGTTDPPCTKRDAASATSSIMSGAAVNQDLAQHLRAGIHTRHDDR